MHGRVHLVFDTQCFLYIELLTFGGGVFPYITPHRLPDACRLMAGSSFVQHWHLYDTGRSARRRETSAYAEAAYSPTACADH
eukprot:6202459-Pleurochrysis_carterae.AAC.3